MIGLRRVVTGSHGFVTFSSCTCSGDSSSQTLSRASFHLKSYQKLVRRGCFDIKKELDKGTKFIIAEAPTGAGKSDTGIHLALYKKGGTFLTTQKILQDQYAKEFNFLKVVKGKTSNSIFNKYIFNSIFIFTK